MPQRNISLTGHYDDFVENAVNTGHYNSASEVVRAGLHLLEKQEQEYQLKLQALRAAVKAGEDAYHNGDYTEIKSDEDFDKFFSDIDEEISRERANAW